MANKISSLIREKGIGITIFIMIVYIGIIFFSDIDKVSKEFLEIKYEFVIVILALESITLFLRSYRQKKIFDNMNIKLSLWKNFKILVLGMSMIVTPGGAGMLIKSHFLKKKFDIPISKTAPIVLAERYHDFLALITILLATMIILIRFEILISVIIGIILLMLVYLICTNISLLKKMEEKFSKIKFFQNLITDETNISESIKILKEKKSFLITWGLSLIIWSIDAVAIYCGFLAFNLDIGIIESIQVFFSALMYGTISFLPAGIGITEGIFIGLLLKNNLEISLITSLIVLIRLTTIWFYTIIGFIGLRIFAK